MIQKEIELQKIQILDSDFYSFLNFLYSILIGFFVGLSVLFLILRYQNMLIYVHFVLSLLFLTIFVLFSIIYLRNKRKKHLILINELLQKIENYESLPSLDVLKNYSFW
jgi:hypothetical protein